MYNVERSADKLRGLGEQPMPSPYVALFDPERRPFIVHQGGNIWE
jgi:hypothetical protein